MECKEFMHVFFVFQTTSISSLKSSELSVFLHKKRSKEIRL